MLTDHSYIKIFLRDTVLFVKLFGDQLDLFHSVYANTVKSEIFHDIIANSLTVFLDDLRKLMDGYFLNLISVISTEGKINKEEWSYFSDYIEQENILKDKRRELLTMTNKGTQQEERGFVMREYVDLLKIVSFEGDQKNVKNEGLPALKVINEASVESISSIEENGEYELAGMEKKDRLYQKIEKMIENKENIFQGKIIRVFMLL